MLSVQTTRVLFAFIRRLISLTLRGSGLGFVESGWPRDALGGGVEGVMPRAVAGNLGFGEDVECVRC